MGIYHYLLGSTALLAVLMKNKKRAAILAGIQLFLVSMLRAETVGADLRRYLAGFNTIAHFSWADMTRISWESGYLVLNKVIASINASPWFFLACTSFIIVFSVVSFSLKHSPIPAFSIFIYISYGFFFSSFSLLRMYLAISLTLLSIHYAIQKKYVWFAVFTVVAYFFHRTALFLFLFPIVDWLRKTRAGWVWLITIVSIIYVGANPILRFLSRFARIGVEESGASSGSGYSLLFFYVIILTGIILYTNSKSYSPQRNSYVNVLITMMVCSIILQVLSTQHSVLTRATHYFLVPAMLMIPNITTERRTLQMRTYALAQGPTLAIDVAVVGMVFVVWYIFMAVAGSYTHGAFPYVMMRF